MLLEHGTPAYPLTAAIILRTAQSDIDAKEYNRGVVTTNAKLKKDGRPRKDYETKRRYAFRPSHVKASVCAADLLKLALEDGLAGQMSFNLNTARIYREPALIADALALAMK